MFHVGPHSHAPVLKAEEDSNTTPNPRFEDVLAARLNRRGLLMGGVTGLVLTGTGLTACGGGGQNGGGIGNDGPPRGERLLGFKTVPKSLLDQVQVPEGYDVQVLYALGDPLSAGTPAFRNDGTDTGFEQRAGDHHDGMEWFGLNKDGKADAKSTERGLLAINHEATTDEERSSFFLHADGGTTTLPRPAAEVDKETAVHGVSIVEVRRGKKGWSTVQASAFNRRLTCLTEGVQINGPARGNALLVTKYSVNGTQTRGTLNNCGTGRTPWGTLLTGEENWAGYFTRSAEDDAARGATSKGVVSLKRYGRAAGAGSRHGWESAGADDRYARWNIGQLGTSADGSDDYRNEINTFGYIVEIDAYDKTQAARKRTAMGRFAHESAAFGTPVVGQSLSVYMGDDSRGEYIYRFLSTKTWVAADANPANRITTGDSYLDDGKLYVAKFNSDGQGTWVELATSNPLISGYAPYAFADQADVLVNARLAADAVGATKMDRPEWCSTNVANGEIYFTLTNNSNRAVDSPTQAPDSANPRVYTDDKVGRAQVGNSNGHILRVREDGRDTFTWDVYAFGSQFDAPVDTVNLSQLSADQDFSSPDGLAFSRSTGIMWIQTDDGAYTDVSNCMMLAALPGEVGDGGTKTLNYTQASGSPLAVTTYVGEAPGPKRLKRFLVGPSGCEITGLTETPDGKAVFVNIQHPGESTTAANVADPTLYTSQWPSNAGYGAGKRPRSATIVITKRDGGRIGS